MLRGLIWFFLLMMFFQLPYYKEEAGPLFLLAKLWPLVLAPLILYGMVALRLPDRALYLGFTVYALAVTPFLSMVHLPNGLGDALAATAKAWPITFYFSAAAALVLLRPSEASLVRAVLTVGGASFGLLVFLWLVVPVEWYQPTPEGPNMFSWDEGRGNFIRMPMMLGMLALFWLAHRMARERRLWQVLLLLGGLAALVMIYRARLPTGVSILLILAMIALQLPRRLLWALGAVALVPAAMLAFQFGPRVPGLLAAIFDESLFIRLRSVTIAWNWVMDDPLRLIFGSGSISTFSAYTLADHFRSEDFWITDIGWLGVLMEYGVLGTAMLVLIHARSLFTAQALRGPDAFRAALATYVLFEILCSAVYSVMYAPGPVVTVAAIAWWLHARDRQGLRRDEPGLEARPLVTAPALPAPLPPAWARGRVPRGPSASA